MNRKMWSFILSDSLYGALFAVSGTGKRLRITSPRDGFVIGGLVSVVVIDYNRNEGIALKAR
ncbi:MAG: hypothetical protein JRJ65_09240 [Deltaproteobacteria bacterium]|nr:hypothetical protein [Deltaproteobacteria bacterium]